MRTFRPVDRTVGAACIRRGGYTLIELLIVVAILGLASALLIPHMVGRASFEAQAAVRQLIADLSFAQSDALAHQEYRKVHFYDDGSGYCIVRVSESNYADPFDPSTADYVYDPLASTGNTGGYIVNFAADDRFESVQITDVSIDHNRSEITYDPLGGTIMPGGTPGIGGSVTVASPDHAYRVDIAPFTGKLTVTKVQ